MLFCVVLLLSSSFLTSVFCQMCPKGWDDFHESCYKFIRSPVRNREGAQEVCRAYNSELVSVNTFDEHNFIVGWLRQNDPQHRRWYTSGYDVGDNYWNWEGDNTQFSNIDSLWLPKQDTLYWKYVSYNYSDSENRWGLQKVPPSDELAFICEIFKENLYQLIIQERPIDYGMVLTDKQKIPRGPYFVKEPVPVVFDLSGRSQIDDISLRCVAKGYPPPVYKWYKEEYDNDKLLNIYIDPLSNPRYTQTDGTLTINHPEQQTDRGKYHCTAENKFGKVISQTVQLGFGHIGEFNKKRSQDSGKEYWGKSISCDPPQHYPKVNYYWTRNKFPNFVEEDRRVFVSHDGNLYFSSLENLDQANYSCNVQSVISSTGRTGPFFPLIVEPASSGQKLLFPNNFPKAFPEAPLAGEDVRLECVAYGYPVPLYNWTRRYPSGMFAKGAILTNYNRALILPKVRVEDMGEYVCTATNGIDTIQKGVTLSVQARPEFTIPLENQVMDEESTITWTCEAFGIPDVQYQWYRNGVLLTPLNLTVDEAARYKINENILTIEYLKKEDQGMYQCEASNQLGAAFSTSQLRILNLKPNFQKYPLETETYAAENGNVTIACRPEAAPFPTFSWRKHYSTLPIGGRIQILQNGYLKINPVRREDEGDYTCIAKNSHGTDSSTGRLVVLSPPRSLEVPRPKVVAKINEIVELPCRALANSLLDLSYIWLHNDLRIDFRERPQYTVGLHPGYLTIFNASFAEAGRYTCIAKTSVGRVFAFTELIIIGPPGAPGAVIGENFNATSGIVQWVDGYHNGNPINRYIIEGRTNHNSTWKLLANITYAILVPNSGRREFQLENVLSPWSIYQFQISAGNDLGIGPPSDASPQYRTKEDRPYYAPRNVGGGGGKAGSLTISWTPLYPEDWNAPSIWYIVYYRPVGDRGEFRKKDLHKFGNIGLYVVPVGEENYFSPYMVKVRAVNEKGEGPESEEVEVYSAESMPRVQPSQVYAVPYNSTALNVTWNPLDQTREKIRGRLIGHRIKYWKVDADPETDSIILLKRGTENWGLIVGLQPDTEYKVATMAYNDAGSGPESEFFVARTYKAAPLRPPTSVKVRAISPTSVKVIWRGVNPTIEEEPIQGYLVRYWEADQDFVKAKEVRKYLDGGDLEAVVTGLVPGKIYKLRVMAFSSGGDGKMSSPPWEFKVGEGVAAYTSISPSHISCAFLVLLLSLAALHQ